MPSTVDEIRRANLATILRKHKTHQEFAEKVGVAPAQISQWLHALPDSKTGKPRNMQPASARRIEAASNKPSGWLDQNHPSGEGNTTPVDASSADVPLISWVRAGNWSSTPDPFLPGDADEWIPCPAKHSPSTIALRVTGDSMYDPTGKHSYADGEVIYVDPERTPGPGDRCVVRLDDRNEATFKQLVVEDGRRLLKALNPDWKPRYLEMDESATLVGLVIGKWVPE